MTEYCGICRKSYKTRFEKFYHYDIEHKEICPICDQKLDGGKAAKIVHIQFHKEYPCTVCWRIFAKLPELTDHMNDPRTHLYRCNKCRLDFENNSDMWMHYEQEHFVYCPLCFDKFRTEFCNKLSRDVHFKKTHDMFPCRICYEVFFYEVDYREHFKNKHQVSCNLCNETFCDDDSKQRHFVNIHLVLCQICKRRFNTQLEYQHHYNDVHRIHCDICNETFPDEQIAGRHNDRYHNHSCNQCKQICTSTLQLQLHFASKHQWKCTVCDGVYESEDMRRRHIQVVHQFPCNVCSKVLDSTEAKEEHLTLVHQLKCDICDKMATTISELRLHYEVMHNLDEISLSGLETNNEFEKDCTISCSVCNDEFNDKLDLYEHYRDSHINFCNMCDKEFLFFIDLTNHKAIHE